MQGMMLAERPADSSMSSGIGVGGGGGGGSVPSVSIGNYKGVMLCNRPFAGVAAAAQNAGGPAKAAFVCGTVPGHMGANAPPRDLAVTVKRTKKETALSRHKKWLQDLQATKNQLEQSYLDEIKRKEEAKKRFMERESKMRAVIRASRDGDSTVLSATMSASMAVPAAEDKAERREEKEEVPEDEGQAGVGKGAGEPAGAAELAAAEKLREKQGRANRPAWALTEDKAKEVAEKQEEDDTAELLEFAQNLDFDKYIDDMEVQAMIDQVKTRINELEIMKDEDVEDEEVKGEARPHTLTEESVRRLQEKYGVVAEEKPADDDAISVARSLLSNTELNKVHSTKSVAAVAASRKAVTMAPVQEETKDAEQAVAEPKMVKHTDDEGSRLANKTEVHHLPYMHRNPSV